MLETLIVVEEKNHPSRIIGRVGPDSVRRGGLTDQSEDVRFDQGRDRETGVGGPEEVEVEAFR